MRSGSSGASVRTGVAPHDRSAAAAASDRTVPITVADETHLPRLQPCPVDQRPPGGGEDHRGSGRIRRIDPAGQRCQPVCVHGDVLRDGPRVGEAEAGADDPVTGGELVDLVTDGGDHTCEVAPDGLREPPRWRRLPRADLGVDGVDAAGVDLDEHLRGCGCGTLDGVDLQDIGGTVVVEADGAHATASGEWG
jgi:hypothetical protein